LQARFFTFKGSRQPANNKLSRALLPLLRLLKFARQRVWFGAEAELCIADYRIRAFSRADIADESLPNPMPIFIGLGTSDPVHGSNPQICFLHRNGCFQRVFSRHRVFTRRRKSYQICIADIFVERSSCAKTISVSG